MRKSIDRKARNIIGKKWVGTNSGKIWQKYHMRDLGEEERKRDREKRERDERREM